MSPEVFAITLVCDDLSAVESFYSDVFATRPVHSDEVSRVFKFGSVLINCLERADAVKLFAPATTVSAGSGQSSMLTVQVQSVDDEASRLATLGVELNTEPTDQQWGIRTITFVDPAGQLWEFSHPL